MSDMARYNALINRQKSKLAYARKLAPRLAKGIDDYGPAPSPSAVAEWLQRKRIRPSANAKPDAKWVAQTVKDYVYMDGVEPTPDVLRGDFKRDLGFRVAAFREFAKTEATIRHLQGDERADYEQEKLDRHMADVVEVAQLLRSALRLSR